MSLKQCFSRLSSFKRINLIRGYSMGVKERWDIVTAVCLERKPVITPILNELEQKYQNLLTQIEYEGSFKSDHELRHEQDLKQQLLLKQGEGDVEVTVKETAQDVLDAWNEEYAIFKLGERITEDDKLNNIKSLNRKLDKHLVLVVKQKLGANSHFLLPQSLRQEGESLRRTAERVLNETCGSSLKAQFYGNAPSGFYKYKYPKEVYVERNVVGAKVFMYFAKLCEGQISTDKAKELDYKWLDRNELNKELHSNYYNSLSQFLVDEK